MKKSLADIIFWDTREAYQSLPERTIAQRIADYYPLLEDAYLKEEVDPEVFWSALDLVKKHKDELNFKNTVVKEVIFGLLRRETLNRSA